MSGKDENSMIGYDPLAWLHEAEDEKQAFEPEIKAPDAWVELDDEPENKTECADSDGWVSNTDLSKQSGSDNPAPAAQAQTIVLNAVQNIQAVSQLHAQFLQALGRSNKIDIDASAVIRIDTATLQLLLILKQTAIKQQKEVSIDFPSDNFIEAAKLLGLSEVLNVEQLTCGLF